jgi:Arc/MetJ family transcription regulator
MPLESDSSGVSEDGKSTIAMGILMTSGFVWMPMCQPHRARTDSDIADTLITAAANCPRWHVRRNALCDHMKILLPQATRESVEKEFAERKTSMTRKVSQYFKAMYCTDYDVDLI